MACTVVHVFSFRGATTSIESLAIKPLKPEGNWLIPNKLLGANEDTHTHTHTHTLPLVLLIHESLLHFFFWQKPTGIKLKLVDAKFFSSQVRPPVEESLNDLFVVQCVLHYRGVVHLRPDAKQQ